MDTLEDRLRGYVKLGAEKLDQEMPKWYTKVNTNALAMSHVDSCVLGQVYGNYWEATRLLFPLKDTRENASCLHGYNLLSKDENGTDSFKILKNIWIEAINERRNKAAMNVGGIPEPFRSNPKVIQALGGGIAAGPYTRSPDIVTEGTLDNSGLTEKMYEITFTMNDVKCVAALPASSKSEFLKARVNAGDDIMRVVEL